MINGKYTEQEISNINEIEQLLNKDNQYVSIRQGSSKILQFVPGRKIEQVEKPYNGQTVMKIRFIVKEPDSGNNSEKSFDVGRRSARLIIAKLREGHTSLKIERIDSGKDILYIPTPVSSVQ